MLIPIPVSLSLPRSRLFCGAASLWRRSSSSSHHILTFVRSLSLSLLAELQHHWPRRRRHCASLLPLPPVYGCVLLKTSFIACSIGARARLPLPPPSVRRVFCFRACLKWCCFERPNDDMCNNNPMNNVFIWTQNMRFARIGTLAHSVCDTRREQKIRCKIMNAAIKLGRLARRSRCVLHSHIYCRFSLISSSLSFFFFFVSTCFFLSVLKCIDPEAYIIGFTNYKAAFPLISGSHT